MIGSGKCDVDRYCTLLTSLPYPGKLFKAEQTPLSRIKLDSRLSMLAHEDAALLRDIEELLHWPSHFLQHGDEEIIEQARGLVLRLSNPMLREIVESRMELRTVVAALRRRKRGEAAPAATLSWGYGRWLGHISRHWSEPAFGLEGVFPWLIEANRLLTNEDSLGFERLLLGVVWDNLGRAAEGHYFDFEAVVIYVLRWDIIDRWTAYSGEAAIERFNHLVDAGLGEFAEVFD